MILLGSMVRSELPPPTLLPAFWAIATGIALLLGFALPPLIALARVPPLRVLRRDLGMPRAGGALAYGLGIATIALLIAAQAQDAQMALIMIGGIAALLALAGVIARLLVAILRFLPQRGYSWRYGLANLRRRPLGVSMQIGALGLGLMALLLLTMVRGDLMQTWRASLPADAHGVPDQCTARPDGGRTQFAEARTGDRRGVLSDGAGRLVAINDVPFDTTQLPDDRARRLGEREFNLSSVADLPAANTIVAGRWWKSVKQAACRSRTALSIRLRSSLATR